MRGALVQDILERLASPSAKAFAVLIEVGEIIVGVAFMVTAIVWLTRSSPVSRSVLRGGAWTPTG